MKKCSIDVNNIKSITFPFVNLGIGDAVCHTGLWRKLKNEGFTVKVIIEKRNQEFFSYLTCVDKIYLVDIEKISHLPVIETDCVICPYTWMKRKEQLELKLLSRISYHYAISVGGWLKRPFNNTLLIPERFHITTLQKMLLDYLGYPVDHIKYDLTTKKNTGGYIDNYLRGYSGKKIIVINPFASVVARSMTEQQVIDILSGLSGEKDCHFFLTGHSKDLARLHIDMPNVSLCLFDSLWDTISLIERADLVVSVDTSVVHIASTFDKELVAVFYSENIDHNSKLQGNIIFAPNTKKARQIIFNNDDHLFDANRVVSETLAMLSEENSQYARRA